MHQSKTEKKKRKTQPGKFFKEHLIKQKGQEENIKRRNNQPDNYL